MAWNVRYSNKNKYNNVKQNGYDSRLEANYALILKQELKEGLITDIKEQVMFDLRGLNGKRVCGHRVDFVVTLPNGKQEAREVKGFATSIWQLKKKLFEDNYPDIDYIVIH
jgi:hypothetical protein